MTLEFAAEDPRGDDVQSILSAHLAFATSVTPEKGVFALDASGLLDPAVTLFGAREDGALLGIGAIKALSQGRAEVKSMHTIEMFRRRGVGKFIVERLILEARKRGLTTLLLETGTMDAFAPARTLYLACGFAPCERFGVYANSLTSICMSRSLELPNTTEP